MDTFGFAASLEHPDEPSAPDGPFPRGPEPGEEVPSEPAPAGPLIPDTDPGKIIPEADPGPIIPDVPNPNPAFPSGPG